MSAGHVTSGHKPGYDLNLSIGAVDLDLFLENEKLLAAAEKRYAAFAVSPQDALRVRVEEEKSKRKGETKFASNFQTARVEVTSSGVHLRGVTNEYALDSLMRIFLSWELLSRAGFLLHAATILRNGQAYVFMGKSGAGKSTVASLSPRGTVLTDEISLLQRKNGEWRAYGTPFWGEFRAAGSNTSAPVAGIFRLSKARKDAVTPLTTAQLLRALLPNVLFFSTKTEDHQRLLEITGSASAEIPGHTLEFRKHRKFWEVLP